MIMNEEEMLKEYTKELIEYAKKIAEHCAEHDECNENCEFYADRGVHVCLFRTAMLPCKWDFKTIEE